LTVSTAPLDRSLFQPTQQKKAIREKKVAKEYNPEDIMTIDGSQYVRHDKKLTLLDLLAQKLPPVKGYRSGRVYLYIRGTLVL